MSKIFKTRAEKLGGHYDVRIFSASGPGLTFACVGVLTMDEDDYPAFKNAFRAEHELTTTPEAAS